MRPNDREMGPNQIEWVIERVLAVGSRPGYPVARVPVRAVDQWLEPLRQQGIRSIINMLSDEEMELYYRALGQPFLEYCVDAGFEVRQVSVEEQGIILPKAIWQARVLTAFDALTKPVLIHCDAGVERSRWATDAVSKIWRSRLRKRRKRVRFRHHAPTGGGSERSTPNSPDRI